MRQSETSVFIYLHKRPAGTWGTNGTYGTSEQMITFSIEYSWNKRYIRNFWNISAGTLGPNGTYK